MPRAALLLVLVALLTGCGYPCRCLPPPTDASEDASAPDAGELSDVAPLDADPPDGGQCSGSWCPASWLCRERRPGEFACEPPPDDAGACPGGWQLCDGRCWLGDSPLHCGACGVRCADNERCTYDDGGITFACSP